VGHTDEICCIAFDTLWMLVGRCNVFEVALQAFLDLRKFRKIVYFWLRNSTNTHPAAGYM
jgi:hypothetical protein